jgi:hypothetical protein
MRHICRLHRIEERYESQGAINMNTNNEEVQNTVYNPFPEPQTIPSGWDLSGLMTAPQIDSDINTTDSREAESN